MKFKKTKLTRAYVIELEKKVDDRGFLARTWGIEEFAEKGINFSILQGYITESVKKGTMRGFHYLKVKEQKLTKVLRGSVYEVIIDVDPKSPTYKKWQAFTFKDTDYKMLYMGPGIAHAILTLEKNTQLLSLYSPQYAPGNEGGIRYNDPSFKINWPLKVSHVSAKDTSWEDFKITKPEKKLNLAELNFLARALKTETKTFSIELLKRMKRELTSVSNAFSQLSRAVR